MQTRKGKDQEADRDNITLVRVFNSRETEIEIVVSGWWVVVVVAASPSGLMVLSGGAQLFFV